MPKFRKKAGEPVDAKVFEWGMEAGVMRYSEYIPRDADTYPTGMASETYGGYLSRHDYALENRGFEQGDWNPYVMTVSGRSKVNEGDWIVPEANGRNFYPVTPDVFELMYEVAPLSSAQPKKIIPNGVFFVAQCERCNYRASSDKWEGGGQIADTGDYGDSYCPVCGQVGCDEADDDEYFDQTQMLTLRIKQLRLLLDEKEWELYEAKNQPTPPPIGDKPEPETARDKIMEVMYEATGHKATRMTPKPEPEAGENQEVPEIQKCCCVDSIGDDAGCTHPNCERYCSPGGLSRTDILQQSVTTMVEDRKTIAALQAEISSLKEQLETKKEARRLDREEYAKWINGIFDDRTADWDIESLVYRLAFEFDAHISCVYEGGEQWESQCAALQAELSSLKGEIKEQQADIEHNCHRAIGIAEERDSALAEIDLLRKGGASLRNNQNHKTE